MLCIRDNVYIKDYRKIEVVPEDAENLRCRYKIDFYIEKEKELIVLNSKLDIAMIEVRNKDYIIDSLKSDNEVLRSKLVEIEAKLVEVSKLGFIDKLRFKWEK
jgi:hypothetical protein